MVTEVVLLGRDELRSWLEEHPRALGDEVQEQVVRLAARLAPTEADFATLAAALLYEWLYYEGMKLESLFPEADGVSDLRASSDGRAARSRT